MQSLRWCPPVTGRPRLGRLGVWAAVWFLVPGSTAFAQGVTPASVAGTWARQGETKPFVTFGADSTVALATTVVTQAASGAKEPIPMVFHGRWHMVGDTLFVTKLTSKKGQNQTTITETPRLVAFENGQLTLTRLPSDTVTPRARVYERLADSLVVGK